MSQPKVLSLFGTRPEVVKLAPIIQALEACPPGGLESLNVLSGQHTTLVEPFIELFNIRVDHNLRIMEPGQHPSGVCGRLLAAFDPVLQSEAPALLLVQGDTTTAMAGALAAFHRGVPVGHVEAGLRTGDPRSPFPEEMNRRLISRLATYHFAATDANRRTLIREGVESNRIFVTGNPVVDAVESILTRPVSPQVVRLLDPTEGLKRIVVTTHRRESFGAYMTRALEILSAFVESHPDTALLFPVHPNPAVTAAAAAVFRGHPRIQLVEPLPYDQFVLLLSRAWLIVSDSGGVQEEAPTLGKPVLVLRENTERPEAVSCGIARLVGARPERLRSLLEQAYRPNSWVRRVGRVANPFGDGQAGRRIVGLIEDLLCPKAVQRAGRPIPAAPARPGKTGTRRTVARGSELRS
jgi:UDP-N-acetylglucosamine 2-epimerase (non-hydrolysing)